MSFDSGRRSSFKKMLVGGATLGTLSSYNPKEFMPADLKGNINHGVCHWCFRGYSLEDFCVEVKKIGIKGVDLIGPSGWETLKKHGLDSSMCNGAEISLTEGFGEVNLQFPVTSSSSVVNMTPPSSHSINLASQQNQL